MAIPFTPPPLRGGQPQTQLTGPPTPPPPDQVQGNKRWTYISKPTAFEYGGHRGVADQEEQRYAGLANSAESRGAVQQGLAAYNSDMAGAQGFRNKEDYALDRLRATSNGGLVTPAQQQLQQGLGLGLAGTQSQVAGARGGGGNLVAAQAAGADAAAAQTGAYNNSLAQLKASEYANATQAYGNAATSQRAGDLQAQGIAGDVAARQASLEASQRALNDQRNLGYEQMRRDTFANQMASQQAGEAANAGAFANATRAQQARDAADRSTNNAVLTGLLTAGGAVVGSLAAPGVGTAAGAAAGAGAGGAISGANRPQQQSSGDDKPPDVISSDVRNKKNIGDGAPAVRGQLAAMVPYAYQYRDPQAQGAGPGQRVGVMAQDMERGPYGGQLVKNTPQGKKIDGPGGLSLALAGTADHEKRIQAIEQRHTLGAAEVGPNVPASDRRYLESTPNYFPPRDTPPMPTVNVGGPTWVAPPQAAPARVPYGPTPTADEIARYSMPPRILNTYGPTPTAEEIAGEYLPPTGLARASRARGGQ